MNIIYYISFIKFSNAGESAGHYYPIPVHANDLSGEFYGDALPSLAQRLWSKLAPFQLKFHKANKTPAAPAAATEPNYEQSDLEKLRNANIQRNNNMLMSLGLATVTEDAKANRSDVKVRRTKNMSWNCSSSSNDGSCDDGSSDDGSQEDDDNSADRKYSTCETSVPAAKADTSVPTKKQKNQKKQSTGEHDDATTPFLYLVGTTHYDPDDGVKNPDAGVFKVDSVVVEHYKDGDEVVVFRCKYNELTRTWNPVNKKDAIRVADVVQ